MKNKVNYQPFFYLLLQIAEIALRLPVSNAWPECLARMEVTTRCRNSLQNEMLEALLMVLINGLSVKDCGLVVKLAVKMWLAEKKRKKVPPVKRTKIPLLMDNSQTVQQEYSQPDIAILEAAEPILEVSSFAAHHDQQQTVQEEVAEIGTLLDLPPCSPDSESTSDYASDCEF